MQMTVMQVSIEGLTDVDYPPVIFNGHLTLERCIAIAQDYGSGYPTCLVEKCDDTDDTDDPTLAFHASFSNTEDPPTDEVKGDLELWFFNLEVQYPDHAG